MAVPCDGEDVTLGFELTNALAKARDFGALGARQAISTTASVEVGLVDTVSNGLSAELELHVAYGQGEDAPSLSLHDVRHGRKSWAGEEMEILE